MIKKEIIWIMQQLQNHKQWLKSKVDEFKSLPFLKSNIREIKKKKDEKNIKKMEEK